MTIGERIKLIRKKKGLTQKQVADGCGMADSAIRKYESGLVTPKPETLQRLAAALGIHALDLVGFSEYDVRFEAESIDGGPISDDFASFLNSGIYTMFDSLTDEEKLIVLASGFAQPSEHQEMGNSQVNQKRELSESEYRIVRAYRAASKSDRAIIDNIVNRYVSFLDTKISALTPDTSERRQTTAGTSRQRHTDDDIAEQVLEFERQEPEQQKTTPVSEGGLEAEKEKLKEFLDEMNPVQLQMYFDQMRRLKGPQTEALSSSAPLEADKNTPESDPLYRS